jgi:tetratricopeptide (TPR) repeat protein
LLGKLEPASQAAAQAVPLARESGNPLAIARSLAAIVQLAVFCDEMDRARDALQEGLPLARESASADLLAFFLKMSGSIAVRDGDLTAAQEFLEEVWTDERFAVEDPELAWQLSGLALLRGEVAQARAIAEKGIEVAETLGEAWFAHGHTAEMLARALIQQGELDAARRLLQGCLAIVLERGSALCPAHVLEGFARLALTENQPERAVQLLGAASAIQRALGMSVLPIERLLLTQTVDVARHALNEATYTQAWGRGAAMRVDEAVAYALDAR